ncbi:MAG: DUF6600 domain-containing protein [Chryseosolibacter sp.]
MKSTRIFLLTAIALNLAACSPMASQSQYNPDQQVTVDVFYTELSPFGRWIDYRPYGYVWIPDVAVGFSPYATQGHWVYTSFGWTWYSYYAWGWAPFHYGRWHYDVAYGWMWFPDTVWGPAWVVWRRGGGYSGWTPLGIGITVKAVIGGRHIVPHEHWVFVRDHDLPREHIHQYRVERSKNPDLIRHAPIPARVREEQRIQYMPGPDRTEIEQTANRRINEVEIAERSSPGATTLRNDRLNVYKPEIRKEAPGEAKPAPERVYKPEEIEMPSDRRGRTRPDVSRQPEPPRQPDVSRQPREEQRLPARRPSRSTEIKKKAPDSSQPQKRSDRNRRGAV